MATDGKCTFFVVTSGKPSPRSKRIWYPNVLTVPVPVRSAFGTPRGEDVADEVLVLRSDRTLAHVDRR